MLATCKQQKGSGNCRSVGEEILAKSLYFLSQVSAVSWLLALCRNYPFLYLSFHEFIPFLYFPEDRDIDTGSPSSNHIEETENPIYSTEDDSCQSTLRKTSSEDQVPGFGAVSECELYEPSEDHIYNSIQGDQNKNDPKSHENNYDYATRDYVLLMRQQCPPEGQAQYNSNTKNYSHYPHERNFVQIERGKVGLKTGQAEDGHVYQIPDQGEIDLNKDPAAEGPVYQDVELRETDLKKDQAKEGPVYHVLEKGEVALKNGHGEEEVGLKNDQAVKSLVYDVLMKGEIGLYNHGSEEDPTYQVVEV